VDTIAYTKHLLMKNFGFKEESGLSEKLGFNCLSCSMRDALMLVSYSKDLMFLRDEGSAFKVVPSELTGPYPLKLVGAKGSLKTVFDGKELVRRAGLPSVVIVPIRNGHWFLYDDNRSVHKSLDEFKRECPEFFENRKVLVFWKSPLLSPLRERKSYERNREKTVESFLKAIKTTEMSFSDFVPVEMRSGSFFVIEDIFRYAGGMVLRNRGYLVTDIGVGDVNAFRILEFTEELVDKGVITCGGFLLEIALHEILDPVEPQRLPSFSSEGKQIAALIEAEGDPSHTKSSSPHSGFGQVADYLERRDFINQAFVCGPICSRIHEEIGTISFMANGTLFFNDAKILPRDVSGICGDMKAFVKKLLS